MKLFYSAIEVLYLLPFEKLEMKKLELITKKDKEIKAFHIPLPFYSWIDKSSGKPLPYLWSDALHNLGYSQIFDEIGLLFGIIVESFCKQEEAEFLFFSNAQELCNIDVSLKPTKVNWRYCIEFTRLDKHLCRELGVCSSSEFLEKCNYYDRSLDNRDYFIASVPKQILPRFVRTFGADVTMWSFFLGSDRDQLYHQLLGTRPNLKALLNCCEIMITIQAGVDEGYLNYILIHSIKDMTEELQDLKHKLNRFMQEYQDIYSEFNTHSDEMLFEILVEAAREDALSRS